MHYLLTQHICDVDSEKILIYDYLNWVSGYVFENDMFE